MEREVRRLTAVLQQIAHDAGCALLGRRAAETARYCTAQYNRIHARIAELDPALAALFGALPAAATAGQVRIVARALAASIQEKTRAARKKEGAACPVFAWPFASLKVNFCC